MNLFGEHPFELNLLKNTNVNLSYHKKSITMLFEGSFELVFWRFGRKYAANLSSSYEKSIQESISVKMPLNFWIFPGKLTKFFAS